MVQTLKRGLSVGSPQNFSAPPSLGRGRVASPPLIQMFDPKLLTV